MHLSEFDYALPDELIARFPPAKRRDSRLLDVGPKLMDRKFASLSELLEPGDLLVFNDTRVIAARLYGKKATGGRVEALIERIEADHIALSHLRASKSPPIGCQICFGDSAATVLGRDGDLYRLQFEQPIAELLEQQGEVPLPPYLERAAESADRERYQTVYAREPGAVAAPTAGLHFDQAMLDETLARGVRHAWLTLHVGAGTFQALRHDDIEKNVLHTERVVVGRQVCDAVADTRERGGRVIAVGTTTVRSLESAAATGTLESFDGETDLFIRPGFDFRVVDAMITNFHLPKSSLLMLVAAFAGKDCIQAAYEHAVRERYRFFSYGDAMFVQKGATA